MTDQPWVCLLITADEGDPAARGEVFEVAAWLVTARGADAVLVDRHGFARSWRALEGGCREATGCIAVTVFARTPDDLTRRAGRWLLGVRGVRRLEVEGSFPAE